MKKLATLSSVDSRVIATGAKYSDQHYITVEGEPGGGVCGATGFSAHFQQGPLTFDSKANGATLPSMLYGVIRRLEFYQETNIEDPENEKIIQLLYQALELMWDTKWEKRGKDGLIGI